MNKITEEIIGGFWRTVGETIVINAAVSLGMEVGSIIGDVVRSKIFPEQRTAVLQEVSEEADKTEEIPDSEEEQ